MDFRGNAASLVAIYSCISIFKFTLYSIPESKIDIPEAEALSKNIFFIRNGKRLMAPARPRGDSTLPRGNNGLVSRGRSSLPSPCSLCNPMTSPGLQSEQRLWSEHLPREGDGLLVQHNSLILQSSCFM